MTRNERWGDWRKAEVEGWTGEREYAGLSVVSRVVVGSRDGEPNLSMRFRWGVVGADGGPALLLLCERRGGDEGAGSNSVRTIVLNEAFACSAWTTRN